MSSPHNVDIEVLLWVGGDRPQVEAELVTTLTRLAEEVPDGSVTFLIDGPGWNDVLEPFLPRFTDKKEISLPSATGLPQVLYSLGLLRASRPYVAFVWPGCDLNVEGYSNLLRAADRADIVYGDFSVEEEREGLGSPPSRFLRRNAGSLVPAGLCHPVQYGWLQMLDCLPMHNCLVSREAVSRFGVFDPSPLLQELFWWDFTVRLARPGRIEQSPVPNPGRRWSWRTYPFRRRFGDKNDSGMRYIGVPGRRIMDEQEALPADIIPGAFVSDPGRCGADGAEEELERLGEDILLPVASPRPAEDRFCLPEGRRPLRVVVLGGLFDPHHNQLYFFNFFERLSGLGLVTWRTIVYDTCLPSDLDGNDLVIFSRPRYPECAALIDHCRQKGLRTLLMIDDNWIAAGREYPRYRLLFTPGRPPFEAFLHGLSQADGVLVFNKLLEEDIKPLTRRVLRMPPNVELDHFTPQERSTQAFVAGFAGSPRFEDTGFRSLARFASRRKKVSVFVMAHEIPEALSRVPDDRILFFPYRHNYFAYARTVSSVRPDVLLAPLDDSRFAASKSPIKYLETAAAGAAGIYSRRAPYTEYVRDGETGLLVENEESEWLDALERLYADAPLRSRIIENARSEIKERFSTERLIPAFLRILLETVGGVEKGRGA